MVLEQKEQIKKLISDKSHILIAIPRSPHGDAIGSALALFTFLANMGKRADIVSPDFVLSSNYQFLKHSDRIAPSLTQVKTFIITLDVADTGVDELRYDLVSDKLRIFITPKNGIMKQEQVKTAESDFKYDLVFTLGVQDHAQLGAVHSAHSELFHKTPVVNIDHDSSNEHHGHINLIDITATATGELLFSLLKDIGKEHIDKSVATALLTAIIARTRSFKSDSVRPHTLSTASELIRMGADRDDIVKHLYRTRTVNALRLWGTALTHLKLEKDINLVSTTITREDFTRSGATKEDLIDIIDELIINSPEAKLVVLLYDQSEGDKTFVTAHLSASKEHNALDLLKGFNPVGTKRLAQIRLSNKTLSEAEISIIESIQQKLGQVVTQ
jgi:nanoRNase/pAp phosphatase (c-di-AMP/oligoRNAs hydrolase)